MAKNVTRSGTLYGLDSDEDGDLLTMGLVTDDDVEYEIRFPADWELAELVDEHVTVKGTLHSGPDGTRVIRVQSFELDEESFDEDDDDFDDDEW